VVIGNIIAHKQLLHLLVPVMVLANQLSVLIAAFIVLVDGSVMQNVLMVQITTLVVVLLLGLLDVVLVALLLVLLRDFIITYH
jgi:hypothetical protein